MAQGIQALLGVGGEWLNDFSKVHSRFTLLMDVFLEVLV
jgi:hypothetical protein